MPAEATPRGPTPRWDDPLSGARALVVGAAGQLGSALCRALVARGARVRAFDLRPVEADAAGDVETVRGDSTRPADLRSACADVDVVFHCASMILTARRAPRAHRTRVFSVNVDGVSNTLDAARAAGVRALVYTSTNHVVFDSAAARPIEGGDETLPYVAEPADLYTRTKIEAERRVLAADGHGLATCALRPGGIYGPGRCMLLDRLIALHRRGMPNLQFGPGTARVDFVCVEALAAAHLAAARRLLDPDPDAPPVAGEAFFISDSTPLNHAEFVRLVVEGLGGRGRPRRVPARLMLGVAALAEGLYVGLRRPRPQVTRLEIETCLVSNTYSVAKARARLGYRPVTTADGLANTMAARRAAESR